MKRSKSRALQRRCVTIACSSRAVWIFVASLSCFFGVSASNTGTIRSSSSAVVNPFAAAICSIASRARARRTGNLIRAAIALRCISATSDPMSPSTPSPTVARGVWLSDGQRRIIGASRSTAASPPSEPSAASAQRPAGGASCSSHASNRASPNASRLPSSGGAGSPAISSCTT